MSEAVVEAAVLEQVRAGAPEWFPDRTLPEAWRWELLAERPGARLYVLRLPDGGSPAGVLAKVRTPAPGGGDRPVPAAPASARPTLAGRAALLAGPLDTAEATSREYQGLASIRTALGDVDPEFRSVRPLALLEEHHTILMDFLPATSLRDELLRHSRVVPGHRPAPGSDRAEPWRRVGAWLRRYREATPLDGLAPRHQERDAVVEQFLAYDRYLGERLGASAFPGLGRRGARLAQELLPATLPLAPGHHDFAPRNVLHAGDGRISVIDPLWRWAVPAQEDLCRFLVGMRLLGLQVHTHGLAFSRSRLERLQHEVVTGYHGATVPWGELRTYEALILLDKWSALVSRAAGRGPARRALRTSLRVAAGFIAGEVTRVLADAERAAP